MGSSIGQSLFRAVKETFTSASQSTKGATDAKTAAASTESPWQEKADSMVESFIKSGFVKGALTNDIEGIQDRVREDMEAFAKKNPKASKEQLAEETTTVVMRHLSMARSDKQREQKLKERMDELRKDSWG